VDPRRRRRGHPLDHAAADGPANLADALLVAADPAARDRGVLLCFDGRVYPARGVTKVDTLSTRGFDAPTAAWATATSTARRQRHRRAR